MASYKSYALRAWRQILCAILLAAPLASSRGEIIEVVCAVEASNRYEAGGAFKIEDISIPRQAVALPDGNEYLFGKLFETEETLVMLSISEIDGSTKTLHIDKAKGIFVLIEVSSKDLEKESIRSRGTWIARNRDATTPTKPTP